MEARGLSKEEKERLKYFHEPGYVSRRHWRSGIPPVILAPTFSMVKDAPLHEAFVPTPGSEYG